MNAFKVTYTDGSSYTANANGTAETFKAYLMQFGGRIVDENQFTGKETTRWIATVEQLPQAGQRYSFDYDGSPSFFTVTDVTDEHVYYQLDGSMHIHPMCWETWNANTDNRNLI